MTISPNSAVICNDNQSVQLTSNVTGGSGGGGYNYNWIVQSNGNNWNDANGTNDNSTYNAGPNNAVTVYALEVTGNGCGNNQTPSVSNEITVYNLEAVTGSNTNLCVNLGATINLSASLQNLPNGFTLTGASYSWTGPNGFTSTSPTPSIPSATTGMAGTYYVTISVPSNNTNNASPCTFNATVVVGINPTPPTFTLATSGCPDNTIPVTNFTPAAGITYTWHISPNGNSVQVSGGSTSSPTLNFNNGGTYSVYVTASSGNCTSNSSTSNMTITNVGVGTPDVMGPTGYINTQNYGGVTTFPLCSGGTGATTVDLTNFAPASNNPATTYTLNWGGTGAVPFTSTITENLIIGDNPFVVSATYNGCTVSENFNVYAGSNPFATVGTANSTNLCSGQTVNFSINPLNPFNNNLPNASGTTYTISFSDTPGVSQTFTDLAAIQTVPHTFTATSCGQSPAGFPANTYYATLVATNACGTTTSTVSPITVNGTPVADFTTSPDYVCVGNTSVVSNTGISGYTITGSGSSFSCTANGKFVWSVSPATGWNLTAGSFGSTAANVNNWVQGSNSITLQFTTTGTYTVTQQYANGCGTSQLQKTICVVDPPTCSMSATPLVGCTSLSVATTNNSTQTACGTTPLANGYTWQVTGASNPASTAVAPTFLLTNNGSAPATFNISLTTSALNPGTGLAIPGCAVTCSTSAIVYPQPYITTQPISTQTLCVGGTPSTLSLSYTQGYGTPNYQWYSNTVNSTVGGTLIPGATSSTYTPSGATVGATYYYCITTFPLNTYCNSITTSTAYVNVVADPLITTQPTTTQTLCVGGTASNFSMGASGGTGTFSYQWYTGSIGSGTPISGATSSTYAPGTMNTAGTFDYYGIVSQSGNGCTAVSTTLATIVVNPDPVVTAQPIGNSYCQNASPVTPLSVTASGGSGSGTYTYQWFSSSTNTNTGGTLISGATNATYTPSVTAVGTVYYYCVITNGTSLQNCSVNSANAAIVVTPAPSFTTQPAASQLLCTGGATTALTAVAATGTGTASYQWYSNTVNSTTGGTPIAGETTTTFTPPSNITGTTYYYCVATITGGGCSNITSSISAVTLNPDPSITTQPITSQTICVGGSITPALTTTLTGGSGTASYQWYTSAVAPANVIAGATTLTYTPPTFTTAGTYNYLLQITYGGNGCDVIVTQPATIVVVPDPVVDTQPAGASYCQGAGGITPLSVAVSGGSGTFAYQWYSSATNTNTGGTLITGATNATYTPSATAVGTVYYYCVITQPTANCDVTSNTAAIVVTSAPVFSNQPLASQSICDGGTPTSLNVAYSNGTGIPSYQWYSNTTNSTTGGTAITGANTNSYTPSGTGVGTTYYYCIVSFASGGCSVITSNVSTLTIVAPPVVSTNPSPTQTICVGGSIPTPLTATSTGGTGTTSYQWYTNSVLPANLIAGATAVTYTPPTFTTAGTYNYVLNITYSGSNCGSIATQTAAIVVIPDPTISTQPAGATYCQNASPITPLTVTATGGSGTFTYQWYSNATNNTTSGTAISGATSASYTPPSTTVGTIYYYCMVSQSTANCGVTSNTAAIVITAAPSFTTQPVASQNVCVNGSTAPLTVAYTNGTGTPAYQWYSNTTNTTVGGTAITGATASSFTPPSTTAGTFYYYCIVSFTGGGCSVITSTTSALVVNPYPSVAISGNATICNLQSTPLVFNFTPASGLYDISYTANGSAQSINNFNGATSNFTVSPNVTTTYVITNIAFDGVPQCAITPNTNIVVTVNPLPSLTNANYVYCSDVASTTISYILDANTYTYDWLANANYAGQTNGTNSITISLPNPVNNAPTTFYYVTHLVNTATLCAANDSIPVVINPNPSANFTLPTLGCQNQPVVLSNGTNTAGTYTWNLDGNFYSSAANPTNPVFTTTGTHTIEMIATNAYGCHDTLATTIDIIGLPVSLFTADTTSGCAPLSVNFTNQSSGQFITDYTWTFAPDTVSWNYTSSSATLTNPGPVTYLQGNTTTNYPVTLAVTNQCGTVTSNTTIQVLPTPVAYFTLTNHTICSGTSAVVTNLAVGEPTNCHWDWVVGISNNCNLTSLYFPSDSLIHTYPITLSLSNACGSDAFTDSVTVMPDNVQAGFTVNVNQGCEPLTVNFTNTSADPNFTTFWHFGDLGNTNAFNQNQVSFTYPSTSSTGVTNYNPYLVVSDGCAYDTLFTSIQVYENPIPVINVSDQFICEGSSITFDGTVPGSSTSNVVFSWDFGGLGSSNSAQTTFTFNAGSVSGTQVPVTLSATVPTIMGQSCTNTATTNVTIFANPDLSNTAYNTTSGCSPMDVAVSGNPTSFLLYTWGDGTTSSSPFHTYSNTTGIPQNYQITIDAQNVYPTVPILTCTSSAQQVVSVFPQPIASFTASSLFACFDPPVQVDLTSTSIDAVAPFDWIVDTQQTSSFSNQTTVDILTPGVHQIYLAVHNQYNCVDTTMQFLNIDAVPVVTLTPDATEMCEGTTVNFTIDCTNVATSYWDFGDGVFEYHLSPTSLSHTYTTSGLQNIMVIVQSLAGCQDTLNFPAELLVHPIPTASFLTNTISADITYPYFEFYNNSINATAYYWNFGDGSWSNDVSPTYVYQNEGEYLATLTATNQYGCVDQTSMLLAVDGIQLYVPNAFTPLDYDGINDVFLPSFSSTGGIDYYELIIFNRWGVEVFKTNDINEGWIGNSKEHLPGEDNYYAQNDAYIWQISYRKKAKDGEMPPAKVVTGHVMILR